MNFFDSLIKEVKDEINFDRVKKYPYNPQNAWDDCGANQLVLQRESAYELDGLGIDLVTSADIGENEVLILGEDLNEIISDRSFARISIVSINDVEDEQKAYNLIKKIEYVKYHYFPTGYMMRTSSSSFKEVVRLSKQAIADSISFEKVGNLLIGKYLANKSVKSVKVIYVTDKNFNYSSLKKIADKNNEVQKALNHVMNSVNFDCSSCNLKPICDEVEGMKELHFKKSGM